MSCPFCGEPVPDEAERCDHCGERLTEAAPTAASTSPGKVVAIVIVCMLAVGLLLFGLAGAFVYSRVNANRAQAYQMRVQVDQKMLGDALKLYRVNVGSYPDQLEDLWVRPPDDAGAWRGPYVAGPVLDPWGYDYVYSRAGAGFSLTSYGEDGAPGGSGLAADISSDF